ncbi:MAG: RAMP superfamily CRISPR-associated protein [Candidatus Korarchaeum sp.]
MSSGYDVELFLRIYVEDKKLLIGSGAPMVTRADITFTKVRRYGSPSKHLLIPGSTVKGVLRTSLIRTAHLIGEPVLSRSVHPSETVRGDVISSLFGSVSWPPSKVIVENVIIDSKTEEMAHVRINDETRTAEEGGLFVGEYLPEGSSFDVRVLGRGLTLQEARALFLSILEMNYERIGRGGIATVRILDNSRIPPDLAQDDVVREILEGLRDGSLQH